MDDLRTTPLIEEHRRLNARLVPFAGYLLPVQYDSVIAESKAVREGAGMFDVSHMGRLWLRGPRVLEFLEHVTTNDVSKLTDGTGQYSLIPNEQGGAVDDIIIYRIDGETFRMVVNAANHEKDVAWLDRHNTFGVAIDDETDATAMIAVQGPRAVEVVAGLTDMGDALRAAPLFGVTNATIAGVACFAPRSGYTGEDGFELICAAGDAAKLWQALLEAGVKPCGLGARDVLRVEAGLPLYGHELTDEHSPLEAGLGWVVSKVKSFVGHEHYRRVREEGGKKKLVGIQLDSKRLMNPGMSVYFDQVAGGEVVSGVFSPMLDCGIGTAWVDPSVKVGDRLEVDIRGKREPGTVTNKRFFKREKPS